MADDDDDLGGGTLVMSPEERPPITGAVPKALPPPPTEAPLDPGTVDDSWDEDAPGTFIMNPADHTSAPTPASPFADSKKRDSWPMAKVVVGADAKQPGIAHAQTLMGGMQVMEEAEAILAQREQQAQMQQAQMQQMQMQQPPGQMQPPARDGMMGFPSQPQLSPHSPLQGLAPNEPFPSPGFYGSDPALEPQAKPGLGPLLLGAGVGLLTVSVVVGGYYAYRALSSPGAPPNATAAASAAQAPAGSATVPAPSTGQAGTSATAEPQTSAAAPLAPASAGSAEAEARAALEKLAGGIKSCVATTIGRLPGTAPAVPSSLSWLKSGSYKPAVNDFESPVYHCARFKLEQPMRFVIQWQSDDLKGTKGSAIAWIDDNGDGSADRAFGFSATLPKRKVAEIGPIESVDAKRAIKKR